MAEKRISCTELRRRAYKESNLPYSFVYKIRKLFTGKSCPICGANMDRDLDREFGIITSNRIPSVQHDLPISKGGKHELGNISVICKQCNITLQDNISEFSNAEEVKKEWEALNG